MAKLKVDSRIYIFLAVLLFLIPLKWLAAWVTAICFHELMHVFVVKLYGGSIRNFSVDLGGANMECVALTEKAYLLSVLAGPIGGLALVLLGCWLPRVAICSWLLSVYNLLPVLPLDGGRVLQILLKKRNSFDFLQKILLFMISIFCVYLCFFAKLGILPMVVVASLWIKNRKIPCKEATYKVQ